MQVVTRREFVKAGAVVAIGVAAVATTGCSLASEKDQAVAVDTPSTSFGGTNMRGHILVGYATRTGSTVGVAEEIGKTLAARGFSVDVKPLRERPSLTGYDAAVLGSAVNGAAWLPEAVSYVESNRDALAKMPVAGFCVHSMNGGSDPKQTKKRTAYLDKVRSLVSLRDEGFFLGKGPDADDTSLIARWAFKAFGGSGEGDMRDWDKIRGWASEVEV